MEIFCRKISPGFVQKGRALLRALCRHSGLFNNRNFHSAIRHIGGSKFIAVSVHVLLEDDFAASELGKRRIVIRLRKGAELGSGHSDLNALVGGIQDQGLAARESSVVECFQHLINRCAPGPSWRR